MKPLPLVTRIIGRRGKRNDIMKPEEKYTVGINNDIIQSQSQAQQILCTMVLPCWSQKLDAKVRKKVVVRSVELSAKNNEITTFYVPSRSSASTTEAISTSSFNTLSIDSLLSSVNVSGLLVLPNQRIRPTMVNNATKIKSK